MNPDVHAGGAFPDLKLPDHRGRKTRLSELAAATTMDRVVGFDDGYPLVVVFYRGFY